MTVINTCKFVIFYEYILLIIYTRWIVFKINEQIPERRSCLSTFRDMYLEVVECLNDVNKSIYGLPAIIAFIAANVADIIYIICRLILFPRYQLYALPNEKLLLSIVNVLTLYTIGHATEKEVFINCIILFEHNI